MHRRVFRDTSILNKDTLIRFLSGKEENIQVLKYLFFIEKAATPFSKPETVQCLIFANSSSVYTCIHFKKFKISQHGFIQIFSPVWSNQTGT